MDYIGFPFLMRICPCNWWSDPKKISDQERLNKNSKSNPPRLLSSSLPLLTACGFLWHGSNLDENEDPNKRQSDSQWNCLFCHSYSDLSDAVHFVYEEPRRGRARGFFLSCLVVDGNTIGIVNRQEMAHDFYFSSISHFSFFLSYRLCSTLCTCRLQEKNRHETILFLPLAPLHDSVITEAKLLHHTVKTLITQHHIHVISLACPPLAGPHLFPQGSHPSSPIGGSQPWPSSTFTSMNET